MLFVSIGRLDHTDKRLKEYLSHKDGCVTLKTTLPGSPVLAVWITAWEEIYPTKMAG